MTSHQSVTASPGIARLSHLQFSRIFVEIRPALLRYALSLARSQDLAEDLVQDAAISAWRYRDTFIAGTNFKAWLYHILRNKFLSHIRHKRVAKTDFYGDDCPDVVVASGQEATVHLDDVRRHWARLAPDQQRAIQLVGVDGRSYEDAAAVEGISVGTLKSRVSRGRQRLQAMIDGDARDPLGRPANDGSARREPSATAPDLPRSADETETDRAQIAMLRAWRRPAADARPATSIIRD